jgi:hypothetical protein
MSFYSTIHYYTCSNYINLSRIITIVSYKYYIKYNKEYYLLSLSKKYRNYKFSSIIKCKLVDLPILDFS